MSSWTTWRCDRCGIEARDTYRSDIDGWEVTDDGDDLCPRCFRKHLAEQEAEA